LLLLVVRMADSRDVNALLKGVKDWKVGYDRLRDAGLIRCASADASN